MGKQRGKNKNIITEKDLKKHQLEDNRFINIGDKIGTTINIDTSTVDRWRELRNTQDIELTKREKSLVRHGLICGVILGFLIGIFLCLPFIK